MAKEMDNLQRDFQTVGLALHLSVEIDKIIYLSNGEEILASIYLANFAGPKGIMIFSHSKLMWPVRDVINADGYGYSVMTIPADDFVDIESYKEVLIDWGWTGDRSRRPQWIEKDDSKIS